MKVKGLILAAGLGTRLRPLTESIAKPALPILGVPSLWFGAIHLHRSLGLTELAINVSHAPDSVRTALDDVDMRRLAPIDFFVSDESEGILGSSGALWKLREWIGDNMLAVFNGDSICLPDWRRLQKQHQRSKGLLTMHLRSHQQSREAYTEVQKDDFNRILGFGQKVKSGFMFSGAYLLEPQAIKRLPAGASELMQTLLKPLSEERQLFAAVEDIAWYDTGTIETYAHSHFELLNAYPHLRDIVELKMQEVAPHCWVPRHWNGNEGLSLHGPCVLYGDANHWRNISRQYGPYFIGMEQAVPPLGKSDQLENAVAYKGLILPLSK